MAHPCWVACELSTALVKLQPELNPESKVFLVRLLLLSAAGEQEPDTKPDQQALGFLRSDSCLRL